MFRAQIAERLPGAVTGDVEAFLAVGRWRLESAALTQAQEDEYRRYVLFGLDHGML